MEERLWDRIRHGLKSSLPPHVYASLVEPARCNLDEETRLHLDFSDSFCKENFEEKCLDSVKALLAQMSMPDMQVTLGVSVDVPPPAPSAGVELPNRNLFDQKYSFDNFVVGSSNQFAHAACQAVSKQPGQAYNPLFIFGGAGLGKTHLLKAIGHEIHKREKNAKILLLTSESFTNELIQAIRVDRMREFRDKYRNHCDVILLDDIHFMAGKERTQEEFFYTFNYLHEARKQIVITSDRYPKDIQGLEARLQTRFEWGLVADVQPPDTETRIAILKNKADRELIKLPDNVAQYIASHITSNIRELEGSLHRLQAYAALSGVPISVELAQQILKDIAPKAKHELTADGILKLVALQFNVRTTDLKGDQRARRLSLPRQICMYLLRKHLLMSSPDSS
jgi:chromosomal replication initiator protein